MEILYFLFILSLVFQVAYWLLIRSSLLVAKPILNEDIHEPVSVIICAHNELINIQENIPLILNQDYPRFEVIVVLDNNEDASRDFLQALVNPDLKILEIDNTAPGKKEALTYGIKNASFKTVLLTDADCKPDSEEWIRSMMSAKVNADLVLGYGPIVSKNPSLVADFVTYETVQTALLYLTAADHHAPYMGVGRNMLYERKLFDKLGGFETHRDLASGDDDLFIQALSKDTTVAINTAPESYMSSSPPDSWQELQNQKRRHLSTGVHYKWRSRLYLGAYLFSGIFIWFGSFIMMDFWILMIRFLLMYLLLHKILNRMGLYGNLLRWIWLDLLFYLYWIMTPFLLFTGNKNRWK